ncbi:MAG: hypothetical protein JOZ31_21650 [Verrucomicrobia bacterium]|nr:hypothetical protein [Verrucomicrobiota bacterium]MBV8483133.1 hypothetical protein [Verrucomicrobiota bacterium]
MSHVILLLPTPDILQLANCHKYVARRSSAYEEIYTTTTIKGKCGSVDKILVIGHGKKGGFDTASVEEVANAIYDSGISMTGNKKVAFDTCYAGYSDMTASVTSALTQVGVWLKGKDKACNLLLVGATGPTVTIGALGYSATLSFVGGIDLSFLGGAADKRLVVKDSKLSSAGALQTKKTKEYNVNLFEKPSYWDEYTSSSQIKVWAEAEYGKLIKFAIDFRSHLGPDLDTSTGKKARISVATIIG